MSNLQELKLLYTQLQGYITQIKHYEMYLKTLASNTFYCANTIEAFDLVFKLRYKILKRKAYIKTFNKVVKSLTPDEYERVGYWLKYGEKRYAQRYTEKSLRSVSRTIEKIANKIFTRFKSELVL